MLPGFQQCFLVCYIYQKTVLEVQFFFEIFQMTVDSGAFALRLIFIVPAAAILQQRLNGRNLKNLARISDPAGIQIFGSGASLVRGNQFVHYMTLFAIIIY
jgi:hypothetical protein